MKLKLALACVLGVVLAGQAHAEQGKTSGYMFGDFYYIGANHDERIEDRNGFWFRRIYVTYDQSIDEDVSVRFRLEMSSAGDFTGKDKLTPIVKDAYLKWKRKDHSVLLGLSSTPTWGIAEKVWGYRSVEKAPADLQKLGSSREFGVAAKGSIGSNVKVGYHLMIGNGSSTSTENNREKKYMAAVSVRPVKAIVIEIYTDYDERPGNADRITAQGLVAYEHEQFRAGAQLTHQKRQRSSGNDLQLRLASGFVTVNVADKVWVFGRIDRMLDPNPDGADISYIPFDPSAESTLVLAGVDLQPRKNVHIMPNVEVVAYGKKASGVRPATDVIPRLTFFYKF